MINFEQRPISWFIHRSNPFPLLLSQNSALVLVLVLVLENKLKLVNFMQNALANEFYLHFECMQLRSKKIVGHFSHEKLEACILRLFHSRMTMFLSTKQSCTQVNKLI